MLKLYLPSVPPIVGNNVIVPSETWSKLIAYINQMQEVINAQADKIVSLSKAQETANTNIKTLADALGGIYNAQE